MPRTFTEQQIQEFLQHAHIDDPKSAAMLFDQFIGFTEEIARHVEEMNAKALLENSGYTVFRMEYPSRPIKTYENIQRA